MIRSYSGHSGGHLQGRNYLVLLGGRKRCVQRQADQIAGNRISDMHRAAGPAVFPAARRCV